MTGGGIFPGAAFATAPPGTVGSPTDPVTKVTICHSTGSDSNPYVTNKPDADGDVSGHDRRDGPVWFPGVTVKWGDIIQPFYHDENGDGDASDPGEFYPGKSWTADGMAIFNTRGTPPPCFPTGTTPVTAPTTAPPVTETQTTTVTATETTTATETVTASNLAAAGGSYGNKDQAAAALTEKCPTTPVTTTTPTTTTTATQTVTITTPTTTT